MSTNTPPQGSAEERDIDHSLGIQDKLQTGWRSRLRVLEVIFGVLLVLRLLYPLFSSPQDHLFSDPLRHWNNALAFLHPTIMGSNDPYLYQLWLFVLQRATRWSHAGISLGTGLLCALMPYGWYRALRELVPRRVALVGAVVMALVPDFIGIYAYFMNETLLLSLTGFAFWLTFRARRKGTVVAFGLAAAVWIAAGFTRSAAVPLAFLSLLWVWLPASRRVTKAAVSLVLLTIVAIPAGLHGRANLGYFAPFGNLYLHKIYRTSDGVWMNMAFGPGGWYMFSSPSFSYPTFYPFSHWVSRRAGAVFINVDLSRGREDWSRELARVEKSRKMPRLIDTSENFLFLAFGQSWPNCNLKTVTGWLTVWGRWVWVPLIVFVAYGVVRRKFRGVEYLLPVTGLLVFLWLGLQQNAIVEGRFRLPMEPVFLASAVILIHRLRAREPLARHTGPGLAFDRAG